MLTALLCLGLAASGSPKVVVVTVALDAKTTAQFGILEHAAEAAVLKAGRFELLKAGDVFDPKAFKARDDAARRAAPLVAEAKRALDDLEPSKAIALLTEALSLLRAANRFDETIDAWVLKAASHAAADQAQLARQDIEKIVALKPSVTFLPQFFSPELIAFAATQKKIVGNAKAELIVRTEPVGAAVTVDGVYRGASPVIVRNIMGGRHVVSATLGGYGLGQQDLSPGEGLVALGASELQSVLFTTREQIAAAPEGLAREQTVMALGKRLDAEQVLLLIARKSEAGEQVDLTAMRVDVGDGHNLAFQTAVVPLNDEATVGGVLDLVMASDAARTASKAVFHVATRPAGLTGRRSAGLVLLASSAAFIAAGIFSGLQAQGAERDFRAVPQVQVGLASSYAFRGRAFSVIADVSFLMAAVSAAIGTFFVVTPQDSAGEPTQSAP